MHHDQCTSTDVELWRVVHYDQWHITDMHLSVKDCLSDIRLDTLETRDIYSAMLVYSYNKIVCGINHDIPWDARWQFVMSTG